MPDSPCPQCGRPAGEQDVLCPHCGAATIPQLSNADLLRQRHQVEAGSAGLRLGFYGGAACGAGVGVLAWLTSAWLGRPAGAGDLVVLAATLGVAGAVAGLLVQKVRGK